MTEKKTRGKKKQVEDVLTPEELEEKEAIEQEFGGFGDGDESEEFESSSGDLDDWDRFAFENATWTSLTKRFRALVTGVRKTSRANGKGHAWQVHFRDVEVIDGAEDAAKRIDRHYISFGVSPKNNKCGWTYGKRYILAAGARQPDELLGKVCLFERAMIDYDRDEVDLNWDGVSKPDSNIYWPQMLLTEIEGVEA